MKRPATEEELLAARSEPVTQSTDQINPPVRALLLVQDQQILNLGHRERTAISMPGDLIAQSYHPTPHPSVFLLCFKKTDQIP